MSLDHRLKKIIYTIIKDNMNLEICENLNLEIHFQTLPPECGFKSITYLQSLKNNETLKICRLN